MKASTKNLLMIQFIMLLIIISNFFISNVFKNYVYAIFLLIFLFILLLIYGIDLKKSLNQKDALMNVMICVFAYFLIIYLSGLFIGFNWSTYKIANISNWIYNIIPVFIIITSSELIRYEFINKSNKNKIVVITTCLLFILFESSINFKLYNFALTDELYEYIGIIIIASIAKNVYLTLQCIYTGYLNNLIYRYITEMYVFFVPFVPALGPYLTSVSLILLPTIISFILLSTIKKIKIIKPKDINHTNILAMLLIVFLLVIVGLNSGFFKYQFLTIGSNSMRDFVKKGDIILIEKKNDVEIKKIQKHEILIFNYDNKIICHRIYEKYNRDGKIYFKTKGDNNSQVDQNLVSEEDVIGVAKYKIKYIGLPSIWLQEIFG